MMVDDGIRKLSHHMVLIAVSLQADLRTVPHIQEEGIAFGIDMRELVVVVLVVVVTVVKVRFVRGM